jgi:hypothetical protein
MWHYEKEEWMASFMPDPELEERRVLLQAAASGSLPARMKLAEEYHVHVYSASERAQYSTTALPARHSSTVRRKSRQ